MADLTLDTVTDTIRDALYIGVGAGVLGVQKLQVQRYELTKSLAAQLDEAKGTFAAAKGSLPNVSDAIEDRVKLVEERLESLVTDLEHKLPEPASDLVKQARGLVARAA